MREATPARVMRMIWHALCIRLLATLAAVVVALPADAFDLQGHRGARGLAPENTLPAFARALSIGVTTLELDIGLSRDGVVVVAHDPALNPDITRGPDGQYLAGPGPTIAALTLAEIKRYDVGRIKPGTRYSEQFPEQQPVDGARIPALVEVFDLARRAGNEAVRFNIETKINPEKPELTESPEAMTDALIRTVRDAEMAARVTIQSFDWRTLRRVQSLAPEIATVYLTIESRSLDNLRRGLAGASPWTAGLDIDEHGGSTPKLVKAAGGAVWSPFFRNLTQATLAEAKALGLKVVPWTVNAPEDMAQMIELGVDGIITDRPDRLREVATARGIALPPPTSVAP
ncbi:MAG TPA: glycerophosphodiester phosphodiesterase [Alphaproteobacteria bacterium]|nr:glycerophosphodiester phosphodiesterase [Alphaproteobacteria bacterium]